MNEQDNRPDEQHETAPTTLTDLEAQDAEEIAGGGLTKVGPGTLILQNQSAGFYGTGVYK